MRLWNKKLAASALATISATSGTTIAFAESPTPTLSASQLDQIIIVSGQGFAHSTQITVDAKVDGGSGSGTVPSTANGTLKLGFELPPGFAGHVQLTAKTSESAALATTSIVAKSNTPTPSTTQPQPAQTTTTAPAPTTAPKTTVAPTVKITYVPLFPANVMSADNDLRKDISKAPLAPNSAAVVATLNSQIASQWDGNAAFNYNAYNAATYTVGPETKRIDLKFDNCQNKSTVPLQLYDPAYGAHFKNVPMPDNAMVSEGTDKEISIYDPATDELWEYWVVSKKSDGWYACWGGRMENASRSSHFLNGGGATATGIPAGFAAVGIREMQQGQINHAIMISVLDAEKTIFSYPAQRTDGVNPDNKPNMPIEGQRFRLDPSINVDSLGLHPVATAVAKAAQKYGFIVMDKGSNAVHAENGNAVEAATGVNPWDAMFNGTPGYQILKGFPWDKMQAIQVDYGKPAAAK